jgi:tetratricopeptide (TPR) repeat protein
MEYGGYGRWFFLVMVIVMGHGVLPAKAACIIQDGLELPTGIRGDKVERILAGNYLRHSSHYYRWFLNREKQEERKRGASVSTALGLATAYGHLGQLDKAAATIEATIKQGPSRYSLHIAAGDYYLLSSNRSRAGAAFDRAFEMNPNGEFTKEGFSHHMLDYMSMQAARDRKKKPMVTIAERGSGYSRYGFSHFFQERGRRSGVYPAHSWKNGGREQTLDGLFNMVLCGYRRSPHVYEAIGDLLSEGKIAGKGDYRELAAMAYLRASYLVGDSLWSRLEYRKLAKQMLPRKTKKSLKSLEKRFGRSIRKGTKNYKIVRILEQKWAKKRMNLESRYEKVFLTGKR